MRIDVDDIAELALGLALRAVGASGNKLVDVLNPNGVPAFHNIDHMLAVSRNAVELARFYELPYTIRLELAIAGLFHDAGRLDIPDHENIEKAKSIVRQTFSRLSVPFVERVADYIAATEFSGENDARLLELDSLPHKIMRDSDYLVWTGDNREALYAALAEETGDTITEASTAEFLKRKGCLLERSRELFAAAGFDVPVKTANA